MSYLLTQEKKSTTEVTWEDQQRINKFGRFNVTSHELQAELKAKRVRSFIFICIFQSALTAGAGSSLPCAARSRRAPCTAAYVLSGPRPQKLLEDLDDAENELMVTDESAVRPHAFRFISIKKQIDMYYLQYNHVLFSAAATALCQLELASSGPSRQVRFGVGECFVTMENDNASERLGAGAHNSASLRRSAFPGDAELFFYSHSHLLHLSCSLTAAIPGPTPARSG